jgi:hypothetical protein
MIVNDLHGHIKKYCNWYSTGSASIDITTELCKQTGHAAMWVTCRFATTNLVHGIA